MKSSSYIGLIVFVLVVILAFTVLVKNAPSKEITKGDLRPEVTSQDWSKGNASSTVTLVEYSDFQCPACASYYPILKELAEKYKNEVLFVYRHYPLIQIHMNADLAAQAAEAAGKQGKFWEMHDMIFDKQKDWANVKEVEEVFVKYAGEIGLDLEKFKTDFISDEVRRKITESYKSGVQSGVQGTPTFFLNGKKIQSPNSKETFEQLLLTALNPQNNVSTTTVDFTITP